MLNLPMLACQILSRMKMYDNLANFDKETEKVCKSGKFWGYKVWKFGKFWQGNWKSMQMWPILRRRLDKYENLATFYKWIEKVWRSGMWGSRRFFHIFILILSYVRRIFHVFQKFILFLSQKLRSSRDFTIII